MEGVVRNLPPVSAEGLPLVYILVLCYNQVETTRACLRSLQHLTYPHHRVVLLDNGSDLDLGHDTLATEFPGLHMLRFPRNLGYGRANNKGVAYAREKGAEYVWLLNNDTAVSPESLNQLVNAASGSRVAAAASVLLNEDSTVQTWGGGEVSLWSGLCRNHTKPVPEERLHYLQGASLLLKTRALEGEPFWSALHLYWEDVDLGYRLRKAGWKLKVASEAAPVVHYGGKTVPKRSHLWDYHYIRSPIRFYLRHASFPLAPICWSVLRRLVKRCLQGHYSNVSVVLRGAFSFS